MSSHRNAGGDSYRPVGTASRIEDDSSLPGQRNRHPSKYSRSSKTSGSTYRPGESSHRPSNSSYRPGRDGPNATRTSRGVSPTKGPEAPGRSAVTKKSKKQRTTNLSSRIHSLKNLLQRGGTNLPATVRRDKERELAALIMDQAKNNVSRSQKKNLSKYHFVRFVERQKAQRTIKRLKRELEQAGDEDTPAKQNLQKLLHEAEVDFNYAVYAPLGEKYIGIYPDNGAVTDRSRPNINKRDFAILDEQQRQEAQQLQDEHSNVARSASGFKPPMWYKVEEVMAEGAEKLEALREGKLTADYKIDKELVNGAGRKDADKPSWLDDDGVIDPADLDSDDAGENKVAVDGGDDEMEDDDDEMSDGGFFER